MAGEKAVISIEGMGCAACVASIQDSLTKVKGVIDASVDLSAKNASVEYDPQLTSVSALKRAVREAGYEVVE